MGNSIETPKQINDNTTINLKRKKRIRESKIQSQPNAITPTTKCKLRHLRLQTIKSFLSMEKSLLSLVETSPEQDNSRILVDQIRGSPMGVGTLEEFIDENHAIISTGIGLDYYCPIMSFVDKDVLEPGCTILINSKDYYVVGALEGDVDPLVSVMKLEKAPSETYADIGGLEEQIQEIKESVELPLTNPELFQEMGIKPPKGVILYGVPGTGKTLLAKAVANSTSATFLRIAGSELIQKYLGDGPKLVREMFKIADIHAPSIIFIDEIDAVGQKRYDTSSSGSKEVQRTLLELLNQLDGFETRDDIKVIMATNRIETLDSALIRPGRIDRKIHFGMPSAETKRKILEIHTAKMTLDEGVNLDILVTAKDDLNGADIKAICTEAGMSALRERRKKITMDDFLKAREKVFYTKRTAMPEEFYS